MTKLSTGSTPEEPSRAEERARTVATHIDEAYKVIVESPDFVPNRILPAAHNPTLDDMERLAAVILEEEQVHKDPNITRYGINTSTELLQQVADKAEQRGRAEWFFAEVIVSDKRANRNPDYKRVTDLLVDGYPWNGVHVLFGDIEF